MPDAEWWCGGGGGRARGRAKRVERFFAAGALIERRGRFVAWFCMSVSSLTKLLCLLGLSGGVRDSLTRPGKGVSEDGDDEELSNSSGLKPIILAVGSLLGRRVAKGDLKHIIRTWSWQIKPPIKTQILLKYKLREF